MARWRVPEVPLLMQCFVERVAAESILPYGWTIRAMYVLTGDTWYAVVKDSRQRYVGDITLRNIERNIVHCLDVEVLQLIAKGKGKRWTASKQSASASDQST